MLSYRLHPKTNRFIVLGRKLTEFNVFGKTPSLVLLRLLLQNYQCSLVCLALRFSVGKRLQSYGEILN
jgi:hypothetical protein